MFQDCSLLKYINFLNFDTSKVTNMTGMFYRCSSLEELDLSNFDTSKVSTMKLLFFECSSLKNLNLSHFNTSNVENMDSMFNGCSSLKILNLSHFNTSKLTRVQNMFYRCSLLEDLDLSHFNTSKIGSFQYFFANCESLKALNVSSFNTSNALNMEQMFKGCKSLKSLNLSNFNTEKVSYISEIFGGCTSLKEIEMSNLNFSSIYSMKLMFHGCSSLTSINLNNFNTSRVTNMWGLFWGCSSLKSINLSSFNTSKVTNMTGMFNGCSTLISINLSNFDTSNVIDMRKMFDNCSSLIYINLSNFDTSNVKTMDSMFKNCINLKELDISNFNTTRAIPIKNLFKDFGFLSDIFLNDNKIKYINLNNTIDNGIISNSSINEIDNLLVCQKFKIITNPTSKNNCSKMNFEPNEGTSSDIFDSLIISDYSYGIKQSIYFSETSDIFTEIVTKEISLNKIEESPITSSNIYYNDSIISTNEETIYILNSRVFLLGYTSFNILNSNMFSFFIYFITLKNTFYSQTLTFSINIKYKNSLRILQVNEEANCIKVEPNNEEFNKYYCSFQAKTYNIDDIKLSTNFNFKPKIYCESLYFSSLANMNLENIKNVRNKEYFSLNVFILDNSRVYKYNNTHFEIKGIVEKVIPKFEESIQLVIENELSENNRFKYLNCSILNEKINNYNIMCMINDKVLFKIQGSIAYSGDNLILINSENDTITFNNSEEDNDTLNQNKFIHEKKNNSNKHWIILVIILSIVALLIIIAIIFFVVRKINKKELVKDLGKNPSEFNLNQFTN